jgi:hypothetical protein
MSCIKIDEIILIRRMKQDLKLILVPNPWGTPRFFLMQQCWCTCSHVLINHLTSFWSLHLLLFFSKSFLDPNNKKKWSLFHSLLIFVVELDITWLSNKLGGLHRHHPLIQYLYLQKKENLDEISCLKRLLVLNHVVFFHGKICLGWSMVKYNQRMICSKSEQKKSKIWKWEVKDKSVFHWKLSLVDLLKIKG